MSRTPAPPMAEEEAPGDIDVGTEPPPLDHPPHAPHLY